MSSVGDSGPYSLSGISESDATGVVASGYDEIRAQLGVQFVPTIYRILAQCEEGFAVGVDALPDIVRLAKEHDVARIVIDRARRGLGDAACCAPHLPETPEELRRLLHDYAKANAFGLLFSVALLGAPVRVYPGVLGATTPVTPAPDLLADIVACHGGLILPGFWRDVTAIPDVGVPLWAAVRSHGREGHFARARLEILSVTEELPADSVISATALKAGAAIPPDLMALLAWFPTGISTMIAEVEWLRERVAQPA